MSGILLTAGQVYFLNLAFKNQTPGDLYMGLHTKGDLTSANLGMQLGDTGFLEVTGTDYARIPLVRDTDWTVTSETPAGVQLATSVVKTFTAGAGGWTDVNGYFVALSGVATTLDAIWAESFDVPRQGIKLEGDSVKVIAKFEMKDDSE